MLRINSNRSIGIGGKSGAVLHKRKGRGRKKVSVDCVIKYVDKRKLAFPNEATDSSKSKARGFDGRARKRARKKVWYITKPLAAK